MKAEVPDKIYVHKSQYWGLMANEHNITKDDIEYTRTDAFIEKAEEFIYIALNDGIMGTANIEDFMRLFKKYMEGEQKMNGIIKEGEHCDAQTYYFMCKFRKGNGADTICPYIKNGINYQNDCPHNQLKH